MEEKKQQTFTTAATIYGASRIVSARIIKTCSLHHFYDHCMNDVPLLCENDEFRSWPDKYTAPMQNECISSTHSSKQHAHLHAVNASEQGCVPHFCAVIYGRDLFLMFAALLAAAHTLMICVLPSRAIIFPR